jgi:hypothetical protein
VGLANTERVRWPVVVGIGYCTHMASARASLLRMATVDGCAPTPRSDVLAGSTLPGPRSYPLYHRGAHGTFDDIVGPVYALIGIGVDAKSALSRADQVFLEHLGTAIVRIVPPDDDGWHGYCDLDFAYTAFLAAYRRQMVLVRPNGTIYGSVADLSDLPDLVAGCAQNWHKRDLPALCAAATSDDTHSGGYDPEA